MIKLLKLLVLLQVTISTISTAQVNKCQYSPSRVIYTNRACPGASVPVGVVTTPKPLQIAKTNWVSPKSVDYRVLAALIPGSVIQDSRPWYNQNWHMSNYGYAGFPPRHHSVYWPQKGEYYDIFKSKYQSWEPSRNGGYGQRLHHRYQ